MICSRQTKCFTLIELLVVVAIIGILASLLLPSLKSARGSARQVSCLNNQKNIGTALALYYDDNDGSIPYAYYPGAYGWDDQLRTYLSGDNIDHATLVATTWTAAQALDVLLCPSAKEQYNQNIPDRPRNSYVMPAENNGWIAWGLKDRFSTYLVNANEALNRKINTIADVSGTIALTEIDLTGNDSTLTQGSGGMVFHPELQAGPNGNGFWANPNATNTTLDLHNKEKVNFLLADGHVEAHHPYSGVVVGNGNPTDPAGMWTTAAGD
ncbi:type II secretion system protein [Lentisphaera marina]|uniref:type II secretion system protein n=1 Tax=Lentisphaera marina TaxID=1111041 RepID=UPI0023665272|nr:type II secretion system protein [Lentisphaera marina]MDD7984030.1 type II secretion system protein [Lentisphaera marina]